MENIKEAIKKEIDILCEEGIDRENLDALYKMVDIHKDIVKEELMMKEMEEMNMRYNEGYSRRGYNGYNDEGTTSYGRRRRDSRGRYRAGDEMMERMNDGYSGYSEGKEEFQRTGNYNAKEDGMESLEYMLQSMVEFFEYIQSQVENQDEAELIKKYARKIKEM